LAFWEVVVAAAAAAAVVVEAAERVRFSTLVLNPVLQLVWRVPLVVVFCFAKGKVRHLSTHRSQSFHLVEFPVVGVVTVQKKQVAEVVVGSAKEKVRQCLCQHRLFPVEEFPV